MNLQLFTEDSTQVITTLERNLSDKSEEIKEITSILNDLLNRSDVNYNLQNDLLIQFTQSLEKILNNYAETKEIISNLSKTLDNSKALLEKLRNRRILRGQSLKLKAQIQEEMLNNLIDNFFDNLFSEKLEKLEISIKDSEILVTILLSLLILRVEIVRDNYISWFKILYESLFYLLEYLEEDVAVVEYQDSIVTLKKDLTNLTAMRNIRNLHLLENEDNQQQVRSCISGTINVAKSILWEISKLNLKPKKRFKTLDQLWEYWDDKYTEEEMTKSLKSLEEEF